MRTKPERSSAGSCRGRHRPRFAAGVSRTACRRSSFASPPLPSSWHRPAYRQSTGIVRLATACRGNAWYRSHLPSPLLIEAAKRSWLYGMSSMWASDEQHSDDELQLGRWSLGTDLSAVLCRTFQCRSPDLPTGIASRPGIGVMLA